MDSRLLILGLLKKAPMNGYQVQQVMKQNQIDRWAGLLKGSIYHGLKTMTAEGLLKVRPDDSTGGRIKTTYEITARGRTEFKQLLRTAWSSKAGGFPTALFAAVAFLDELPTEEVLQMLDGQQALLTDALSQWNNAEKAQATTPALPHQLRLLIDCARQHLQTDLRLTESLKLLLGAYRHKK